MIARFAKATGTPVPVLTGRAVSVAEWDAMTQLAGEWTLAEGLLVAIAERVDALRYIVQTALSSKGAQVTKPLRVPRPGEAPEDDAIIMRPHEFGRMMST